MAAAPSLLTGNQSINLHQNNTIFKIYCHEMKHQGGGRVGGGVHAILKTE